jgi:hypothetical protein
MNSMKCYFGEDVPPADTRADEYRILQSLETYFDFISGGDYAPYRRPET